MRYEEELGLVKGLVKEAGDIAMRIYGKDFSYRKKSDGSPVTEADVLVEEYLIKGIKEAYPDDAFLAEESADDPSRINTSRIWIIDPIDGTKEFVNRNGQFTINVGLAVDGSPVLGVVYAPARDEFYDAAVDYGSFCNGESIMVSDQDDPASMVLAESRSHPTEHLLRVKESFGFKQSLLLGSSLKGCAVAAGAADCYLRLGPINEWDVCAMHVVLEQAGGMMTNLDGSPVRYNNEKTRLKGVICSNGLAHDALVEGCR